jgi:hypothetical protein
LSLAVFRFLNVPLIWIFLHCYILLWRIQMPSYCICLEHISLTNRLERKHGAQGPAECDSTVATM